MSLCKMTPQSASLCNLVKRSAQQSAYHLHTIVLFVCVFPLCLFFVLWGVFMLVCLFCLFVWSSYVYRIKNTRGILRIVHFDFFQYSHMSTLFGRNTHSYSQRKKNEDAHHTERKGEDTQHDQKTTEKQKNMDEKELKQRKRNTRSIQCQEKKRRLIK